MKTIFKCIFGSELYGTNTPSSDRDFKSVFIPSANDLIMQKAPKTITLNTNKDNNAKNTSADTDYESFSIQQFIKLLLEGQTGALDMLFCPENMILEKTEEWDYIVKNKNKFLHSGTSAFVGYTKQQAAKYGVKGFRVSALREVLDFLKPFDLHKSLDQYGYEIYKYVYTDPKNKTGLKNEHTFLTELIDKKGNKEMYLEVCNRKAPFRASVKYARDMFQKIFDAYGERALKAEKNEGIDWKALSHAVRVANESIELLNTGFITFPRPDKQLLLDIKLGKMDYKEVEKIIEEGLIKVEEAQKISRLPSQPDRKYADLLIHDLHLKQIRMV